MHPYREAEAEAQIARLARIKKERDTAKVNDALGRVRDAARRGKNVMPTVMDAVEAYTTVGEICGALREVYGTYREPIRF